MAKLYRCPTSKRWHRPSCSELMKSPDVLLVKDSKYIGEEQMCKRCMSATRHRRSCHICFQASARAARPCQHNGGVLAYDPLIGRSKYVWPVELSTGRYVEVKSPRTLVIEGPPS